MFYANIPYTVKESFDSWSESPVKTTIETLPISEIKFPKVTVCPPKNTYTNLNHDLAKAEVIGEFDNDTSQVLLDFVFETIHDGFFEEIRHNSSFLNEENKFHNWYNGYTTIQFIKPGSNIIQLGSPVSTFTLNGSFSTFGFAEEFNSSEVFSNFDATLSIYPCNGYKDKNFTMKIEVFREQIKDLSPGHWDTIRFNNKVIPPDEDYRNNSIFLPPHKMMDVNTLSLERKVSLNDVRNQKLKNMPGMMIKWYIDREDVLPYRNYKGNYKSQIFVRLVNFVRENDLDVNEFWKTIRSVKKSFIGSYDKVGNSCERLWRCHLTEVDMNKIIRNIEATTGLMSSDSIYRNVTQKSLEEAGKMYLYLYFCPIKIIDNLHTFKSILQHSELKVTLLALHRILKSSESRSGLWPIQF